MNVIVDPSVSAAQADLIRGAIAASLYPFEFLAVNLTIEVAALPPGVGAQTLTDGSINVTMQFAPSIFANPRATKQAVHHELGHVVTLGAQGAAEWADYCALLGIPYSQWADPTWANSGREATAEIFKDLYAPPSDRISLNSTNLQLPFWAWWYFLGETAEPLVQEATTPHSIVPGQFVGPLSIPPFRYPWLVNYDLPGNPLGGSATALFFEGMFLNGTQPPSLFLTFTSSLAARYYLALTVPYASFFNIQSLFQADATVYAGNGLDILTPVPVGALTFDPTIGAMTTRTTIPLPIGRPGLPPPTPPLIGQMVLFLDDPAYAGIEVPPPADPITWTTTIAGPGPLPPRAPWPYAKIMLPGNLASGEMRSGVVV